jgi:hypothetical protein
MKSLANFIFVSADAYMSSTLIARSSGWRCKAENIEWKFAVNREQIKVAINPQTRGV